MIVLSRDSSVGVATGFELGYRMIGVRFPVGAGDFSLQHRVRTGSGAHPAFCRMATGHVSLGVCNRTVGLTTHLRLVPRSGGAWSCAPAPPMCLRGVMLG
jgi:hypothetical protein